MFSLAAALFEVATLGSLVPLLAMLADGRAPAIPFIGEGLPGTVTGLVLLFAAMVLVTTLVRLALTAAIQRDVLEVAHAVNIDVQRRLLDQPYAFHASANSSRFVAALQLADQLALGLLRPLVQGFAGLIIGGAILAFLVATAGWGVTLAASVILGGAYLLVSRIAGWRLVERGGAALRAYEEQVRLMMEGSGAIRDVLLDHRQSDFAAAFERASARMKTARAGTDLLSQAPRFLVEALGAIALAVMAAVIAARDGGIAGSLTLFGLLSLAMVRIVPLAQAAYAAWSRLASSSTAVEEIAALLDLPRRAPRYGEDQPLLFKQSVRLSGIRFSYPDASAPVVAGADLAIAAGEWLGLTGPTGAGKSTVGDLLMGLLDPDEGEILVDGGRLTPRAIKGWQQAIGHVSQSAYLIDDSIAANVALLPGGAGVDSTRLAECTRIAQLEDWIAQLPDGYATLVGERGQRVSGGQRQRIAIARALYKGGALLVLDEATNALDAATEGALLEAIRRERPHLAVVLISHRSSTLGHCDRVVQVNGGRVAPA